MVVATLIHRPLKTYALFDSLHILGANTQGSQTVTLRVSIKMIFRTINILQFVGQLAI